MVKAYLDRLKRLMAEIVPGTAASETLEIKHFFSGAAVYADGRICITLSSAGFALKLPKALRDELQENERLKNPQYFPKAPIKREYVVLSQRLLDDRQRVSFLVEKSIAYVLTRPQNKKKAID